MPRPALSTGTGNKLLDRLPESELRSLLPSWEAISLPQGQELFKQNGSMSHVYFPTSGVCSVVNVTEDDMVEAETIGNEGMLGIPIILGLDFSPIQAISQVSGGGLRMSAQSFLRVMQPGGPLDKLMRRYVAFSMRNAHQTVACNALHALEERMSRWLLMAHDRVGKDEFVLTQEFMAEMLGVRRQTVSVVAGTLQSAGFISYRRGVLRIVDREGLESASCDCYETIRAFFDRIVK